jgi:hypothetical protein
MGVCGEDPSAMSLRIVTGNRLSDGVVVYLGHGGRWSESLDGAEAAPVGPEAEALLAVATAMPNQIVGPYLIEVETSEGVVRPVHIKEAIRAAGPTVRGDLGKQAQLTCAAE